MTNKILPYNEASVKECCSALKLCNLVAFPTETVYGLGANAFSSDAVKKIFEAKKRPFTDPLIVHIHNMKECDKLTDMTVFQKKCFYILGQKFWPGPLTIIVRSHKNVPEIVTSGSGYIGIRIPNHPVAINLIEQCGFPLAAPSANLFGHVSPTSAEHVFHDLGYYNDLLILDSPIPCDVGIESTILKIDDQDKISLLRPGAVSTIEIKKELAKHNIQCEIEIVRKHIKEKSEENIDSSGQFLTHYSPSLESFILKNNSDLHETIKEKFLENAVLIDFNQQYKKLSLKVKHYMDLSIDGVLDRASYNLFSCLRKAEIISGAQYILLPDFSLDKSELASALNDRIFRAASGKIIQITGLL